MTTRKRIRGNAHDPHRGMTLDEVAAWLDYARASGALGSETVHVAANIRHGIKIMSIDITGDQAR